MNKRMYLLAVVTLCIFFGLRITYNTPSIIAFDEKMSDLLEGNTFIIFFHYIGEPIFVVLVGLVLMIWLWVRERNYRGMFFVLLTFGAGNVVNQLLKKWVERPRPEMLDQLTSYSFPSGHAMTGMLYLLTIAYLLSEVLTDQKKVLLVWVIALVLICLIGLSRIAESRHFASDVLAGWSIGYTWFAICVFWYERRKRIFHSVNLQER
ncbi:phosphatase PAP2 family protein [Solibacillus sp. CAU 1738]|uniref:phosphatase PAP2 family protein n=1 Tax=Solibacillus sp. CAU 1738 TaxID=3140363 RepID=UPI003260D44B